MRYALLLALASCGRLGFGDASGDPDEPLGPGSDDGAAIELTLLTDETGPLGPGLPLAGATVLVDRGAPALERLETDARGTVTIQPDGVIAYHAIYGRGTSWRVYTVATGTTGPIVLGGNTSARTTESMTLVLPAGTGSFFHVHMPEQCTGPDQIQGTQQTVELTYDASCDGKTVHAVGYNSRDGIAAGRYLDLGSVTLAHGTSVQASGNYTPLSNHAIQISNLPDTATTVTAELVDRSPLGVTPLALNGPPRPEEVDDDTVTVTTQAAAGGSALRVAVSYEPPGAFLAYSERIVPAAPAGLMMFDARTLVAPFESLDYADNARGTFRMRWRTNGPPGTIIVLSASDYNVEWNAYVAPGASFVDFPPIPQDLDMPVPTGFPGADIYRLDVPGASTAAVTHTIDQTWRRWPSDGDLLPAAGSGLARWSYFQGAAPR